MRADRSFHLIEAVADRVEGAPVAGRRRWSDGFKAEMVARSFEPGANVSALAREIGISPSQLFGWRSDAVNRGEVERQIDGMAAWASHCEPVASGVIEVIISDATVRVGHEVSEEHVRRVLRAVRSA
jgi:transposase